jgi:hypothetical protein
MVSHGDRGTQVIGANRRITSGDALLLLREPVS